MFKQNTQTGCDVSKDDSLYYKQLLPLLNRNTELYMADLQPRGVIDYYDKWASSYEMETEANGSDDFAYRGPLIIAEILSDLYKLNREVVKIFDIGAGTGLVGQRLYDTGFRKIDGLDPSEGMLDICKKKNVYTNLFCEYLGSDQLPIQTGFYDCVVIAGAFCTSHIPTAALQEIARLVKSGGFVCNVMREEFLHISDEYNDGKLERFMDKLQEDGVWTRVFRKTCRRFTMNKDGVIHLYKVL